MDREETTVMGTTPSALEQGATLGEKQLTEGAGDDTVAKPRRRGQRLREFKHRVRGKHLEHIPTLKESLIATVRQSCTSQRSSVPVDLFRFCGSEVSPLATADKFVQG
jgi:hypothetical protein